MQQHGESALVLAAANNRLEVVNTLLQQEANIDLIDEVSPLFQLIDLFVFFLFTRVLRNCYCAGWLFGADCGGKVGLYRGGGLAAGPRGHRRLL